MSLLSEHLYMDDGFLFDLLKTEGPKLLANSGVISKLEKWAIEGNHVKINKMKDALFMFFNPKDLPLKVGRSSVAIKKTNLTVAHDYLLKILKEIKRCRDWHEVRKKDNKFLIKLKKVK